MLFHLHKVDKNNYVKFIQSTCATEDNTCNQPRRIMENTNLVVVLVGKNRV